MSEDTKPVNKPINGAGLGLRSCHYQYILNNLPDVPWFEVLTDNYFKGGTPTRYLSAIREHYPITFHGVGLSLGSTDPLNQDYLQNLKNLANALQPAYISDHLCWISKDKQYFHDLLPLPFTQESITHVSKRIQRIQEFLGQKILIENVSSYLEYKNNEMPEWEFINAITAKADCDILLDVNNIYVCSQNHNYDAIEFIQNINPKRVKQFHLAGFTHKGKYLLDTHCEPVHPPVWNLYRAAVQQFGSIPTLIEWDSEIPKFTELHAEAQKAQQILHEYERGCNLTC